MCAAGRRTTAGTAATPHNRGQFIYRADWHEPGPITLHGQDAIRRRGKRAGGAALLDLAAKPGDGRAHRLQAGPPFHHRRADAGDGRSAEADVPRDRRRPEGGGAGAARPAGGLVAAARRRSARPTSWRSRSTARSACATATTSTGRSPRRSTRCTRWPGKRPRPKGYSDDTPTWLDPDGMTHPPRHGAALQPGSIGARLSTATSPRSRDKLFDRALSRRDARAHRRQPAMIRQRRADHPVLLPRIPAEVTSVSHDHDRCNPRRRAAAARGACEGCAESRLLMSRRAMLGVTAGLFSWAFMPRFAEAAEPHDPRLLVVVLRGGMDGINVVVPYRRQRTTSRCAAISPFPRRARSARQLLRAASGAAEFRRDVRGRRGGGRACRLRAAAQPLAFRRAGQSRERPAGLAPPTRPAGSTACSRRCRPAAPIKSQGRHPDRRRAADPARPGAGARLVADLVRACAGPDPLPGAHALSRARPGAAATCSSAA